MRITCPSCAAAYDVPGDKLEGRTVRCVRCGTEWVPLAAEPAPPPPVETVEPPRPLPPLGTPDDLLPPAPEPPPAPPPAVAEPPLLVPAPRPPPARRAPLLLAWVASLLLLAGLAAAGVVWRGAVIAAWPPSERLYRSLNLVP